MPKIAKTYDVFFSYNRADTKLAKKFAQTLHDHDLEAFLDTDQLNADGSWSDALREALSESTGVLVLVPKTGPTNVMMIEIGAALAWRKPIYAVVADRKSLPRLPQALREQQLYSHDEIDDVIKAIERKRKDLTDEDRSMLVDLYANVGVPVDRFALDADKLANLTDRFALETGKIVASERLLSELLRLRKQGKLMRLRKAHRPKTRKESD